MLRYVNDLTQKTADGFRLHLEDVREQEATVFVDLHESLAAMRSPTDALRPLSTEAARMAARWRRAGRRRAH